MCWNAERHAIYVRFFAYSYTCFCFFFSHWPINQRIHLRRRDRHRTHSPGRFVLWLRLDRERRKARATRYSDRKPAPWNTGTTRRAESAERPADCAAGRSVRSEAVRAECRNSAGNAEPWPNATIKPAELPPRRKHWFPARRFYFSGLSGKKIIRLMQLNKALLPVFTPLLSTPPKTAANFQKTLVKDLTIISLFFEIRN